MSSDGHLTYQIGDLKVHAHRGPEAWSVLATDILTDLTRSLTMTDPQFGAMLALSLGGCEVPHFAELAASIAEFNLNAFPVEVIPSVHKTQRLADLGLIPQDQVIPLPQDHGSTGPRDQTELLLITPQEKRREMRKLIRFAEVQRGTLFVYNNELWAKHHEDDNPDKAIKLASLECSEHTESWRHVRYSDHVTFNTEALVLPAHIRGDR